MSPYDDGDQGEDRCAADADHHADDDVFVAGAETGCADVGLEARDDGGDHG